MWWQYLVIFTLGAVIGLIMERLNKFFEYLHFTNSKRKCNIENLKEWVKPFEEKYKYDIESLDIIQIEYNKDFFNIEIQLYKNNSKISKWEKDELLKEIIKAISGNSFWFKYSKYNENNFNIVIYHTIELNKNKKPLIKIEPINQTFEYRDLTFSNVNIYANNMIIGRWHNFYNGATKRAPSFFKDNNKEWEDLWEIYVNEALLDYLAKEYGKKEVKKLDKYIKEENI